VPFLAEQTVNLDTLLKLIRDLEGHCWSPDSMITASCIVLFGDGSGKILVEVACRGAKTPEEQVMNHVFTTEYSFPFNDAGGIEPACRKVLDHTPAHPELG
jgi:hypothetical protein